MVNQGGVVIKSSKTLLFGFLILVFLFVCYFFSFDVSSYVDELSLIHILIMVGMGRDALSGCASHKISHIIRYFPFIFFEPMAFSGKM